MVPPRRVKTTPDAKRPKRKLSPELIVGIIGAIATIVAGIMSSPMVEKWFAPKPTPTNILNSTLVPTALPVDTVTATITPTPFPTVTATFTSSPVPSPIPTEMVLFPGNDWLQNCISTLWSPYPVSAWDFDEHNCLKEAVKGLATNNGTLSIRVTKTVSRSELYGIFTPIDSKATIRLNINVADPFVQSQLWIGVIDGPDLVNGNIMIYSSDTNFVREIIPPYDYLSDHIERVNQADPSLLTIEMHGNSLDIPVNPMYTYRRGISYQQPYLFIGYLLLPGNQLPNIDVSLSNLQITK